jgi:hypothetical protein
MQNSGHTGLNRRISICRPMQARLKSGFELAIRGGQAQGRGDLGHGVVKQVSGGHSNCTGKGINNFANRLALEFERGLVNDEAGADFHDLLHFDQMVGA